MRKPIIQPRLVTPRAVAPRIVAPKAVFAEAGKKKAPVVIDPTWLYFTMPEGGTVTLTKNGSPTEVVLEYSLDNGSTWTEWTESGGVRTLTLTAGQTMHIRNTSASATFFSLSATAYYQFSLSGVCFSGGNTMSLRQKEPVVLSVSSRCFFSLFKDCTSLVSAPELPGTNLNTYCYDSMFQNCSSLVTGPSYLPAMTLGTYAYRYMFDGCSSLVTVPALLPATSLFSYCYYAMFRNCSSLVSAPELFAETLTSNVYQYMFEGCSLLNYVKTHMTDASALKCLGSWLSGVAATGDFYCPASLTIPSGASGIPNGWTRHDIE